ncbi:MAG: nitrilase-related carbon-nitrogen hydrolase [Alphaproteobacteria bacterium]
MKIDNTLSVALWVKNLAAPSQSIEAWVESIDQQMAAAAAQGADILVFPEYAAEQWLTFAPADLTPEAEIAWMAAQAPAALTGLEPLARKHGLALLAGTMPMVRDQPVTAAAGEPPHVNRAWLLLPDGRAIAQDKLCLTPGEQNPAGWNLATGDRLEIVEWRGLRLATVICLDIEMPALAALLAPCDLDLILVPSMTEKLSGYSRVFSCAKARAVELMSAVCAVGCIGKAAASKPRLSNTSGAAVYLPCEETLGHTGIFADLPPTDRAEGPGPMLVARDIPVGALRALRHGKAEVWPGAWRADHVRVVEAPATSKAVS